MGHGYNRVESPLLKVPSSLTTARRPSPSSTLLATLLAAAVLLPLLGHRPLSSWDEGIYSEVSREMLRGGWLNPTWNGQPWLEKPPLTLWITAFFFRIFGVTAFWARAGSALSGVASVALIHGWLVRRRGPVAAWYGTVILLSTFGFLHVAHVGEMDTLLSLGCAIAVCGLVNVHTGEHPEQRKGWWLFWLGFAIAFLAKGAASVVLPITLVLVALAGRWTRTRLGGSFWLGFGAFLAAVLPWHLVMTRHFGAVFFDQYFGYHVLERATQVIENHSTPWWFFLLVMMVSAPPYVLLYPVALKRALRQPDLKPWAIFAMVVLIFFSLVRTRLPHYIAPAYPALSLITAVWLEGLWNRLRRSTTLRPAQFWSVCAIAALALFGISAAVTAHQRSRLHSTQALGASAPLQPDDRELIVLLQGAFRSPPQMPGPLLVWRDGPPVSIATAIFYSQRTVQQVGPYTLSPADPAYNRYENAPVNFADALASGPRLIVMDRSLLTRLPAGLLFTRLSGSQDYVFGTLERGLAD